MNILDEIAAYTKERVARAKQICPDPTKVLGGEPVFRRCDSVRQQNTAGPFPFEKALRKPGLSFITEVKKASPSKGLIAPHFPYVEIARAYDNAGADCISCLTEPHWFQGKNEYLTAIRRATDIPILRKDFTVDDYMIYEAKAIGADAVLLICAILDPVQLHDYLQLTDELGLSAIVEAHDASEIEMAVKAGARIIGVNNRNLRNFTVNVENARALRNLVPKDILFISESGIKTRNDVKTAEDIEADAVLVGETMMRAEDKAQMLATLSGRPARVKICGLKTPEDAEKVNEVQADYAGMVFADTRRKVTDEMAEQIRKALDPSIPAVGVFVDENPERIIELLNKGIIDMAQLHGNESDEEIQKIQKATGKKVIKAVVVKDEEDVRKSYPSADYLLYDAGKGSGRTFHWELLKTAARKQPVFLAGGLEASNVAKGIREVNPYAVDISSGVEDENGVKNLELMKKFVKTVRES